MIPISDSKTNTILRKPELNRFSPKDLLVKSLALALLAPLALVVFFFGGKGTSQKKTEQDVFENEIAEIKKIKPFVLAEIQNGHEIQLAAKKNLTILTSTSSKEESSAASNMLDILVNKIS